MRNLRVSATAWLGTPIGLIVLWLLAEWLVSVVPGTALVFGLLALLAVVLMIGLLFYAFVDSN